jgi:hypothetical protein
MPYNPRILSNHAKEYEKRAKLKKLTSVLAAEPVCVDVVPQLNSSHAVEGVRRRCRKNSAAVGRFVVVEYGFGGS